MVNKTSSDFERIVIGEIPLIDVRAPIEFDKGAIPNAVNLPIMNDEERHLVGICYKDNGNEEAVKLGYKLVSGDIRQSRIDAWASFITEHPDSMIYCFRGGQRSRISQEWIFEATGQPVARIEGGYKAFRNYLITALEPSEQKYTPILLGGYTGSGKTKLLKQLKNSIDLEGIANHRGSSFGRYISPQPTQIDFENNLAFELIRCKFKGYRHIVLEDEGKNVGKCYIPKPLHGFFCGGNLVLMDVTFEERVHITMDEYVIEAQALYIEEYGPEQGIREWTAYISSSMKKIDKRLGGDRYQRILELFENACKEQMLTGSYRLHEDWIRFLLREYYDPMYSYQLQNTTKKILFRGNAKDVLEYLRNLLL